MSSWGKHAGQVVSVAHPPEEYSIFVSASSTMICLAAPWLPTRNVTTIASQVNVDDEKTFNIMVADCPLWVMTA